MLPKHHIIFGAIISLVLYLFTTLTLTQTLIIFLSSFLLDFDHYIFYFIKTKDFSFKNAIKYHIKKRKKWLKLPLNKRNCFKHTILLFHGIEFWAILIILSALNSIFLFILLGIAIHMSLDFIELVYLKFSLYPKFSQIYVCMTNKNKKILRV